MVVLAPLALIAFRATYLNSDALIALAWGAELGRGAVPDVTAPLMPIQHPLPTMVGTVLSPLGPSGMIDGYRVLAVVSLIALCYACFRLAHRLGGVGAGVLAVALILTRPQIIDYALSAEIEIPLTALVLMAAVLVLEEPLRNRWKVLFLLTFAGLLRPEAWALGGAYGAWLIWRTDARPRTAIAAFALCGPALWAGFDLILTGEPLGTAGQASTNFDHELEAAGYVVPPVIHERFGWIPGQQVLQPVFPGMPDVLGAPLALSVAAAGIYVLWRRRTAKGAGGELEALAPVALLALVVLTSLAFLKALGLPYSNRFVILPATVLTAIAVAAAFRLRGSRLARAVLAAAAVAILIGLPLDLERIDTRLSLGRFTVDQQDDVRALADQPEVEAASECGPLGAGGDIAVIHGVGVLAIQLRLDPAEIPILRMPPPPASVLVFTSLGDEAEVGDRPGPVLREGVWWAFAVGCR
jgi:hypothetical protein